MFTTLRLAAAAFAALSLAALAACAGPPPAVVAATPVPPPHGRAFTLDTPVHVIEADAQGKAVLDRDLPGLMASRDLMMVDDMSLAQIASVSGGKLTNAKLAMLQADLAQISAARKIDP
jgi:hypothetical protein